MNKLKVIATGIIIISAGMTLLYIFKPEIFTNNRYTEVEYYYDDNGLRHCLKY